MSNRLMIFLLAVELSFLLITPLMNWDKTRRGFVLAVRGLWLHKLRAFLSVLGIIIGTAAVIALMAFGEGSMQDALEDIKRQGATNVIVRSVKPPDEGNTQRRTMVAIYGLTYDDYERFLTIPDVIRWVPMRVFPNEVRHLERMAIGRVVATTPDYADVHKIDLVAGRFLTHEDDLKMNNYVVLGSEIADLLFPFDDPLGHTVVLNKQDYKVVVLIPPISVGVGADGTTNNLLATATERTREIGTRRAQGGKRGDNTGQILVEAAVQTSLGRNVRGLLALGTVYALPWAAEFL